MHAGQKPLRNKTTCTTTTQIGNHQFSKALLTLDFASPSNVQMSRVARLGAGACGMP